MQTIALNEVLYNIGQKPILEAEGGKDAKPANLRYICVAALVSPTRAGVEEKVWRAMMAVRLRDSGETAELTKDEVERLRNVIGEQFPQPDLVLAALSMLPLEEKEPAVKLPAPEKKARKK